MRYRTALLISVSLAAYAFVGADICRTDAAAMAAAPAPAGDRVVLPDATGAGAISVAEVRSGAPSGWLEANALVVPDVRSLQDVNAYVTGEISQVFVRAGDRLKAGDAVASIYSPEFITTQRSYLALMANKEQLQSLREEGRLSDYMKDARENLKWWGMTEAGIGMLEREKKVTTEIRQIGRAS